MATGDHPSRRDLAAAGSPAVAGEVRRLLSPSTFGAGRSLPLRPGSLKSSAAPGEDFFLLSLLKRILVLRLPRLAAEVGQRLELEIAKLLG